MEDNLLKKRKELFLIFKRAIDGERNAQALYLEAKNLCEDKFLEEIIEGFYQDEVRHERELMERYNKLREDYNFDE